MCKKLHLIKMCLCCFLDIQLFSNSLSSIATISSFIISELIPASFACGNNFNFLHNSLGSDGKNMLFEILEEEIIKRSDFGNFLRVLSQVDSLL